MHIKRMTILCSFVLTFVLMSSAIADESVSKNLETVVFVCEHGAAKSIIAAAYFNKLAGERHLPIYAVARGSTPQAELSTSTLAGLRRDGITPTERKPVALTAAEASAASHVVSFLPLPKNYYSIAQVEEWNDVPTVSDNYVKARDAIVAHVRQLLDNIDAVQKN